MMKKFDKERFVAKLKFHRKSRGLKSNELSKRCECSKAYISSIEKAGKLPSPDIAVKIAEELGITFDFLMSESLICYRSKSESELIEQTVQLLLQNTEKELEIILSIAKKLTNT